MRLAGPGLLPALGAPGLSSVNNSGSGKPGMIMPIGGSGCARPPGEDDPGQAQDTAADGQPRRCLA